MVLISYVFIKIKNYNIGLYMKKIIIIFHFLVLGSLVCSEKNSFEKAHTIVQNAIQRRSRIMMNTTTYRDGSFGQVRDSVLLFLLPGFTSQAILSYQRENMRHFLIKNEERALEGVREYWDLDKGPWKEILEQNRKEHERNLNQLRSEQSINAPHDSSLPSQWLIPVQRECHRYQFNIKNLGLGVTNNPEAGAETSELADFSKKGINSAMNHSINVNYNLKYSNIPENVITHIATHELTHVIKGDNLLKQNITVLAAQKPIDDKSKLIQERLKKCQENSVSLWQILNPFYDSAKQIEANAKELTEIQREIKEQEIFFQNQIQKMKEFPQSTEYKALVAAQEKTADTYVLCIDPAAAQRVPEAVKFDGYTQNHNDMKVMHNNWKVDQAIEKTKPLRKAIGYGDQVCSIL